MVSCVMRFALLIISLVFIVALSPVKESAAAEIPEIIGVITSDTDHTLFGLQIVPMGDQNGDGFDDIIIWDFRPSAYLYMGGGTLDTLPHLQFDSVQNRVSNVGDIDGDGIADLAVNGRGPSQWRLNLYLSAGNLDTVRDHTFGVGVIQPLGFAVNGNDINANGSTELILADAQFKSILLYELSTPIDSGNDLLITPANYDSTEYRVFGEGIISGDFNGDDTTDFAASLRIGNFSKAEVLFYWGGQDFDTLPDFVLTRPGPFVNGADEFGAILINLGDVNGDGFDDIHIQGGDEGDSSSFVFFCGPLLDSIPDVVITDDSFTAGAAGDINNDGFADLITGFGIQSSSFSWVKVYFGGPAMDSLEDIHIDVSDIIGWQHLWGMQVNGVGDINGDTIDDFAVATVGSGDRGQVYIFAGTDIATDVVIVEDHPLPTDFELHQNYPNPFNPETTIEFSLTKRDKVELTIHNLLGQKVRRLAHRTFSAGVHRLVWDGADDGGAAVASGVYFYKLRGTGGVLSRKMLLLK